ncbi:hypoxanthine phosphoribosyltransferase [Psychroflexus salarius]|uniref:Hypoxanthine phosphoribosyltransferase n=1 Tax=Psychroflexus salarius TaxID=1155689 RepID=A0A1M4VG48_9FLAO|nr:hypoxanthine phosphoribosyltransferase [Psychroflexus salarius]SHE67996.1 hypoxanthine phosphoribosyltransferase [Psychroflexus salarius]
MKLHDLTFEPYISAEKIQNTVKSLAVTIAKDYTTKTPVFVGVLNGAFMFLGDLMKYYQQPCEINFTKLASYQGTSSTGEVQTLIGLNSLEGRDVIIVEDIVDTGHTLAKIIDLLTEAKVNSYKIASLFYKPKAYKYDFKVDYVGLEIPPKFIVGYGLDYDGLGRNLPEIYQLKS